MTPSRVAGRIARLLDRVGGTATLTRTDGRAYDDATDTFSGGASETATAPATETEADADRFAALGLTLDNPVTLIVAAVNLTFAPAPGMQLEWAGMTYTVRDVQATTHQGPVVSYRVTGGR